jgi:hypothetical protein
MRQFIRWSEEEDARLRKMIEDGESACARELFPDRTLPSVSSRARVLGLSTVGIEIGAHINKTERTPSDISVGDVFGDWTIRECVGTNKDNRLTFKCLCTCGVQRVVRGFALLNGNSKSCGHASREALVLAVHRQYKSNAKRRNITFLLTTEELEERITQNCYFCGKPPLPSKKRGYARFCVNGVDRLVNDKELGYRSGNCVPCCDDCNSMKEARSEIAFARAAYMLAKSGWLARMLNEHPEIRDE